MRRRASPRGVARALGKSVVMAGDRLPYSLLVEFKRRLKKSRAEAGLRITRLT
ncbi:MAG: hypothetical protein QXP97_06485 [Desulfurococcus sp.]|uniref:hypothetical protein n=1 Tax=Thermoprotei TaxID=183924 RepID=UPI0031667461